jgi:carboxypeptidase family protein
MLFGRVTDAGDAPIPAASITIIDADGHQLLRTTTERHGRYAADGLPEGLLTVLVSPDGRMPVATRVMLADDLPARQDFVIPDATQGNTLWPA